MTKDEKAKLKKARITEVRRLYQEFGSKSNYLALMADALNEGDIKPSRSSQWTPGGLYQFILKNLPDVLEDRTGRKRKKQTEKASPETGKPEPEKKREIIPLQSNRPTFVKRLKSKQTTIRVKDEILERAMKKLEKDRVRVGDSISSLVNILLWMYAGADEDLLEDNPFAED